MLRPLVLSPAAPFRALAQGASALRPWQSLSPSPTVCQDPRWVAGSEHSPCTILLKKFYGVSGTLGGKVQIRVRLFSLGVMIFFLFFSLRSNSTMLLWGAGLCFGLI